MPPQSSHELIPENRAALLHKLISRGPEAQCDIDESILWENLARTPAQRLIEASRAATQIESLKEARIAPSRDFNRCADYGEGGDESGP